MKFRFYYSTAQSSNFNFQETVEQIADSLHFTPEQRKELAEAQKKIFSESWQTNKIKVRDARVKEELNAEAMDGYTSEHLKTVEDLRQDIQDHTEEQKACHAKAKQAIENKTYELATYLSNIAQFHKQKADEAKHEVANLMVGIHEKTQPSQTTIDLHYLNIIEAVTVLENFLDRNISRLRDTRKPYTDLFIITGRGKHSVNGIATIKNKTKDILNRRNLR